MHADVDMASRHRTRARSIQVIRTDIIPAAQARREGVKQFLVSSFVTALPPTFSRGAITLVSHVVRCVLTAGVSMFILWRGSGECLVLALRCPLPDDLRQSVLQGWAERGERSGKG